MMQEPREFAGDCGPDEVKKTTQGVDFSILVPGGVCRADDPGRLQNPSGRSGLQRRR